MGAVSFSVTSRVSFKIRQGTQFISLVSPQKSSPKFMYEYEYILPRQASNNSIYVKFKKPSRN